VLNIHVGHLTAKHDRVQGRQLPVTRAGWLTCTPEFAPFLSRVRFSRRRTNEAEQVLASLAFGSEQQIIAIVKEQEAGTARRRIIHGRTE
jgi:hypothetical protein